MNKIIILVSLGILTVIAVLKITFALLTGLSLFKTGGAVFTTTHSSKIKKILDTLPMHVGQVVYDLGCGDGRFLIAASKKYKVTAIGYEINPWPYLLSRLRIGIWHANVSVRFQDFWKADLSKADIVFCYLFPDIMERLKEKLSEELKLGAKIISCNFGIPGWKPDTIIASSHPRHTDPIYIYTNLPK